jgi:hypothetical protein
MRVATFTLLALTTFFMLTTTALACPLDTPGAGTVSTVISAVGSLLGITTGSTAASSTPASTVTNNTFVTNTTVTNGTSGTSGTSAAPTAAAAAVPIASSGGGGGGGGFGGFAGGGFGGSGSAGAPSNPSSDAVFAGGSGSGASGAQTDTVALRGPMSSIAFAATDSGDAVPLTGDVKLAAGPAKRNADDDAVTVAMASPVADYVTRDASVGFGAGVDAGMPMTSHYAWTLLSGMLGIGVAGAGWAVRALLI